MYNILIAKETKRIIKEGQYELAGEIIKLPTIDYESVQVISPQLGEKLLLDNTALQFYYKSYLCKLGQDRA